MVGYAAGDGGKVRVGGGEEVESYVGGEDFGGEGRGEEGGEARLEDSEGWLDGQSVKQAYSFSSHGVGILFPSFKVRSSGGGTSLGLMPPSSGARRDGLELVNQSSEKTSRSDRT